MAVLLIFTVLMVRIFRWVTGYFQRVNQGIESLLADDEKQIQLSSEMLPFERKLNSVKTNFSRTKNGNRFWLNSGKDELVMYLAHDIRTPLTSVLDTSICWRKIRICPSSERAARVHIVLEKSLPTGDDGK